MKCVECIESEVSYAECVESRVIGPFRCVFGSFYSNETLSEFRFKSCRERENIWCKFYLPG